ncbi:MAG: hypothetical protein GTN71_25560 [Anaerolineae bacterium]|nr:hypothetical protein [Anaerolineae bacterium]
MLKANQKAKARSAYLSFVVLAHIPPLSPYILVSFDWVSLPFHLFTMTATTAAPVSSTSPAMPGRMMNIALLKELRDQAEPLGTEVDCRVSAAVKVG